MPHIDPARARPRPCAHLLPIAARSTTTAHHDGRHSTGTGALAHLPRELLSSTRAKNLALDPSLPTTLDWQHHHKFYDEQNKRHEQREPPLPLVEEQKPYHRDPTSAP